MALIDPVLIDLTGKAEGPGESFTFSGHAAASGYDMGERHLELEDGLSFEVAFTNTGDGILLTGMVRGRAAGVCDRCLDVARIDIAGAIEEYYLLEKPHDPTCYEDGFELLGSDRVVDLAAPLSDAVITDTPFALLCSPDCAGLCPVCGCNLNHAACDCMTDSFDVARSGEESPFAALRDLEIE
ncbi:protein of unknown function DUF177 [Coriobacterium glomerans PW2]|uniref:DUF177 domain-containing protein n=1 Tax=Coriobacterium glomerans (strain ATCC 49209 / DSM 20642 / JCM 10262 / PW2) TaxID=700015 RepID=F2N9R1_CORGP|nr:DUF177 domain-containing protein [Coriobacterium glomerans]AEB07164.1 protein of unknown function DUF177 [Coriobacterium glomerans PW2]